MLPRKTFFRIALLVSILFCHSLVLGAYSVRADANVKALAISVSEANHLRLNQDAVFIDVRTARSWWRSSAKIEGAERGDPAGVGEWEPNYRKDQTLILYCS